MSFDDFTFHFVWACARWVLYGASEATKDEIRNALFVSWCCELKEREEQK